MCVCVCVCVCVFVKAKIYNYEYYNLVITTIQVLNLNKAVCISLCSDAVKKKDN